MGSIVIMAVDTCVFFWQIKGLPFTAGMDICTTNMKLKEAAMVPPL